MRHPHLPPQRAVLPSLVWDYWADWSLSSQVCTRVVKKEKDSACMSALLSSPSPPQIMPLIINRMRAYSSWKAGTGTSLLNGAAQLGLKLFNRNMKAPSVRRTRPSEVTTLSLPSQQTSPPRTGRPAPGAGLCPAPRLFPQQQSSCCFPPPIPAASSSSRTRFFPSWDPSSPLPGCIFINLKLKPGLGSLLPAKPLFVAVCPLAGMARFWPSFCSAHRVSPTAHFLPGGGRAKPCPALQHPSVELLGETGLFGGCMERESRL